MSDLVVVEFLSLDGVMQAPGNAHEDPDGFPYGGWSREQMADHRQHIVEPLSTAGALLFGRRTYDIFAAHWPKVANPSDEIASRRARAGKAVVPGRSTKAGPGAGREPNHTQRARHLEVPGRRQDPR